jgi:sulfonate transport system substrate-binding protein
LRAPVARLGYGVTPLDADAIASQQRIADTFFQLGLIPRPVAVKDSLWTPTH